MIDVLSSSVFLRDEETTQHVDEHYGETDAAYRDEEPNTFL